MSDKEIKTTTIVDNGETITTTVSVTKVEEKTENYVAEILSIPIKAMNEFAEIVHLKKL